MAKDTPSMAKNKIRRSLLAIIDPYPSERETDELWEYFENKCAYCGVHLVRTERKGHQDHIVSAADGGTNDIHNFVLACSICNGDEKREENWLPFLQKKASDEAIFSYRKKKIEGWQERTKGAGLLNNPQNKLLVDQIINEAIGAFDKSVAKMRTLTHRKNG